MKSYGNAQLLDILQEVMDIGGHGEAWRHQKLSEEFPEDMILLCYNGASWHKPKDIVIPTNIVLFYIPSCTPDEPH